jgi:hypothetical protein
MGKGHLIPSRERGTYEVTGPDANFVLEEKYFVVLHMLFEPISSAQKWLSNISAQKWLSNILRSEMAFKYIDLHIMSFQKLNIGDKVTRDKMTGDKVTRGQNDQGTK